MAELSLQGIGQHLASWRRLHRLTQEDVARRAGVSRPVITRLEKGADGVGLGAFVRVLMVLGIEPGVVRALDPFETEFGRQLAARTEVERVRKPHA